MVGVIFLAGISDTIGIFASWDTHERMLTKRSNIEEVEVKYEAIISELKMFFLHGKFAKLQISVSDSVLSQLSLQLLHLRLLKWNSKSEKFFQAPKLNFET